MSQSEVPEEGCEKHGNIHCTTCQEARRADRLYETNVQLKAENARLRAALREAAGVAALKYEIIHKGSGPPSDYDPDIYRLETVTAPGWWRFVHAVRDILGGRAEEKPTLSPLFGGSPFCLDCRHPLTDADRAASVCPYCGCA